MFETKSLPSQSSSWAVIDVPIIVPAESQKWDISTEKILVDFLGASAWDESYDQTFGYRWRGEDTLTWGNPNEWVLINWVRNIFLRKPDMETNAMSKQVGFWQVLQDTRIARLEQVYKFHHAEKVKQFLVNNPVIISILLEAQAVLEKFFGSDVGVTLEVVSDPEASDNSQLFGYIHTGDMAPDVAFKHINAMDEAWFLKKIDLIGGLFNFNLE